MLGLDGITVDRLVAEFAIHGVEVDPVAAGDEGERLLEVGPELLDGAGLAGVSTGDLQAAPSQAAGLLLEAADVVALPAVKRQGDRLQTPQGLLGVDALLGIPVPSQKVRIFDMCRIHPHPSSQERHLYMPPSLGCQAGRMALNRAPAASQSAAGPEGT